MYQRNTVISNPTGLHARPASDFIAMTTKFSSKIWIKRAEDVEGDEEVNAKSIIGLLSLGCCQGEDVVIRASGDDEKEAVDSLIELIDSGFGE